MPSPLFILAHDYLIRVYPLGTMIVSSYHDHQHNNKEIVIKLRDGRHSKKLQMQGARNFRNEAYISVRCSD